MSVGRTALITIELLAASIWVGSLVCLAVVARAASNALPRASRVQLFRKIGQIYGQLGTASLVVAIGVGVALAGWPGNWRADVWAALALSVVLVLITAAGMAQARRMTKLRTRALEHADDSPEAQHVRRGAMQATALRGLIGFVTLVVIVLSASILNG